MDRLTVSDILPGSIADELDIRPGDSVISINDHPVRDIIDFHYYGGDEESFTIGIRSPSEGEWYAEVEKLPGEQLGLLFFPPEPRKCGNKCLFCFVHQLPKGLRKPLYVKDEDYRLSFLYGNFVTLANLSEADFRRIKEQKLSPLYISVHAANQDVRELLLGKKEKVPIMNMLERLSDAGISFHTQIVLCPGINDGEILHDTVERIAALHPFALSIAVVPVGLTDHRVNLPELRPVAADDALRVINLVSRLQKKMKKQLKKNILYLSDEWYLKSGNDLPPLSSYADLPQLENGVGMIPLFMAESKKVLKKAKHLGNGKITAVTGYSAFPFIKSFASELSEKTGIEISVTAVENRLFGSSVTVAGLVCGRDAASALQGGETGRAVIIPDVMIKEGEGVFLDNMTIEELSELLKVPVIAAGSDPHGFYEALRSLN